jgi:hypothetical protein
MFALMGFKSLKYIMKQFVRENWFKLIIAACAVLLTYGYLQSVMPEQNQNGLKVNVEKLKG